MNSNKKTATILEDVKVNVKIKLSLLWVTLMFFYIYADILGFYRPGFIEQIIAGEIGEVGIPITQVPWLGLITTAPPSVMVFLSLTLKAKANRWANIIVGIVLLGVLGGFFLMGGNPAWFIVYDIVEVVLLLLIVWFAWKWPKQEG